MAIARVGQLGGRFVGRARSRDEENALQLEQARHLPCNTQVSAMDGIKSASKNSDPQENPRLFPKSAAAGLPKACNSFRTITLTYMTLTGSA